MSEEEPGRDVFDFQKYKTVKKNRRMIVRFLIYGFVILFLVYLIMKENKNPTKGTGNETIETFDVETTEQP